MKSVEEAFAKIESLVLEDALPYSEALSEKNYDGLLDSRDSNEFATPWTNAYNTINKIYRGTDINQDTRNRVDKVREHVFKRVYKVTEVSDLASYVSDDFDLILRCLITRTQNSWVNALWLSYLYRDIPNGTLVESEGDLAAIVD